MTVVVNGMAMMFRTGSTLADALEREGLPGKHVVAELNGRYVPQRAFGDTALREGDRVELILPAFGG